MGAVARVAKVTPAKRKMLIKHAISVHSATSRASSSDGDDDDDEDDDKNAHDCKTTVTEAQNSILGHRLMTPGQKGNMSPS